MKIVLTNDDGYDAPGLSALKKCVAPVAECIVVAPKHPQSGVGHRVSLWEPISVEKQDQRFYVVDGSPADCTRLALKVIAPDADWLIAGINPGANLGSDIYQSGTVAAAREAAILGCKAIAVSQYISRNGVIDWDVTGYHVTSVLSSLFRKRLCNGQYWNVNMPHPLSLVETPAYVSCPLDVFPHDYRFESDGNAYRYVGIIHDRPRMPGRDVDVCFSGKVAMTKIDLGSE